MKKILSGMILSFLLTASLQAQSNDAPIIWVMDNLTSIGGHTTQTLDDLSSSKVIWILPLNSTALKTG